MLLKVSPSQIGASRTCLRKWHGIYVKGEREPDTDATTRGKDIHKILEDYLNGAGQIDTTTHYGRIAASGLKYLPAPKTVITEGDFEMPGHGWVYHGFIDMVRPYYVGDHKTTSDLKYQKTEAELRADPQVILYGSRSQVNGPGDVEIQWIYYRAEKEKVPGSKTKNSYKALQTRFVYEHAALAKAKAELDAEVSTILSRRSLPMLSLPPSPESCFKYNKPCHLRAYCTDLKPSMSQLMSKSKDDLLAELKAKALGLSNPAGVAMPPPVTQAAPPSGALPSLPSLGGPAPAPAATAPTAAPSGLPSLPVLTAPAATAPAPAAAPAGLPALPAIDPAVMAAAAAEGAKAAEAAKPAVLPSLPAPPGPAQATLPNLTPAAAPVQAPAPAQAPVTTPTIVPESVSIGTLYIDCLPLNVPVTPFSQLAKDIHEGIKPSTGAIHYKAVGYGKGVGIWVEAVKIWVEASGPHKAVFVDSASGDGRDAIEALMGMAGTIVRGLK